MAAHTIMERCFMRMIYLPDADGTQHFLRGQEAARGIRPLDVEHQRPGGKTRRFRHAFPQALFAYPLPKYLEKALPHWRFDNCCIHVIFIRKIFPHVAWAFIGQKQQKSPHMAGLHKKTNFAESMFTQCWAGGTPAPQAPQRRRAKSPGQRPPAVQPSAGSAPRHHRAHRQILKHGRNRCAR